uniref:Gag protein n=1 Tax=Linum usitatissimum TaxID=4006 RepID=I6YHY7_LINUS|nr:gag protein [Linum usitatissimum]
MAVINDDETPGVPLTGAGNAPVDSASQGTVLGILDITNPFYIHPSEHWGQNLVSTLLTEYNYSKWSMAISMVLDGKNKIGFVDGTIEAPDAGQPLYPYWIRNNKLVLSWILRSVSPIIAKSILYSKSARSAWVVLRSRFSQGDAFKIADLQEKVFALKQGTRSVTEFFTELITLYDELSNFRPLPDCACPPPCTCILSKIRTYHDQDRVIRFLRGLTDGFAGARSQVMLLDPLPSLDRVFAMMVQQERDQGGSPMEIFPSAVDSQVMFTRAESSGRESSLSARAPSFKRQEWSQFQQQYQRMVIAFQNSDGASTSQARPPTPQPNMARRSPSMIHEEAREGQQLSRVNAAASRPHQDHITDPDSGLPPFEEDWYS